MDRRQFIRGVAAGGGGMLVLAWLWGLVHPASAASVATGQSATSAGAGAASAGAATGQATGTTSAAGGVIAQISQVPLNSASSFTVPANGDPGVLVHLASQKFVAFDAVCTHAGCIVQYDPGSKLLLCPCHGAAFDPAQGAAVVQGPAPTPLASVAIQVSQSAGTVSTS